MIALSQFVPLERIKATERKLCLLPNRDEYLF